VLALWGRRYGSDFSAPAGAVHDSIQLANVRRARITWIGESQCLTHSGSVDGTATSIFIPAKAKPLMTLGAHRTGDKRAAGKSFLREVEGGNSNSIRGGDSSGRTIDLW